MKTLVRRLRPTRPCNMFIDNKSVKGTVRPRTALILLMCSVWWKSLNKIITGTEQNVSLWYFQIWLRTTNMEWTKWRLNWNWTWTAVHHSLRRQQRELAEENWSQTLGILLSIYLVQQVPGRLWNYSAFG